MRRRFQLPKLRWKNRIRARARNWRSQSICHGARWLIAWDPGLVADPSILLLTTRLTIKDPTENSSSPTIGPTWPGATAAIFGWQEGAALAAQRAITMM